MLWWCSRKQYNQCMDYHWTTIMNTCNFVAKCTMLYKCAMLSKFRAFQRTFGSPQKLWKGCAFHSRGRIFPIVRLLTSKSAKQDSVFGSTERHWAVWKTGQSRSEHALNYNNYKNFNFACIFAKKAPVFRPYFYKNEPVWRIEHTAKPNWRNVMAFKKCILLSRWCWQIQGRGAPRACCSLRNSASSIHWLSSSIFTCLSFVPHSDISSYLHYTMF